MPPAVEGARSGPAGERPPAEQHRGCARAPSGGSAAAAPPRPRSPRRPGCSPHLSTSSSPSAFSSRSAPSPSWRWGPSSFPWRPASPRPRGSPVRRRARPRGSRREAAAAPWRGRRGPGRRWRGWRSSAPRRRGAPRARGAGYCCCSARWRGRPPQDGAPPRPVRPGPAVPASPASSPAWLSIPPESPWCYPRRCGSRQSPCSRRAGRRERSTSTADAARPEAALLPPGEERSRRVGRERRGRESRGRGERLGEAQTPWRETKRGREPSRRTAHPRPAASRTPREAPGPRGRVSITACPRTPGSHGSERGAWPRRGAPLSPGLPSPLGGGRPAVPAFSSARPPARPLRPRRPRSAVPRPGPSGTIPRSRWHPPAARLPARGAAFPRAAGRGERGQRSPPARRGRGSGTAPRRRHQVSGTASRRPGRSGAAPSLPELPPLSPSRRGHSRSQGGNCRDGPDNGVRAGRPRPARCVPRPDRPGCRPAAVPRHLPRAAPARERTRTSALPTSGRDGEGMPGPGQRRPRPHSASPAALTDGGRGLPEPRQEGPEKAVWCHTPPRGLPQTRSAPAAKARPKGPDVRPPPAGQVPGSALGRGGSRRRRPLSPPASPEPRAEPAPSAAASLPSGTGRDGTGAAAWPQSAGPPGHGGKEPEVSGSRSSRMTSSGRAGAGWPGGSSLPRAEGWERSCVFLTLQEARIQGVSASHAAKTWQMSRFMNNNSPQWGNLTGLNVRKNERGGNVVGACAICWSACVGDKMGKPARKIQLFFCLPELTMS